MNRKYAAIALASLILLAVGCLEKDPTRISSDALSKRNQSICDGIADFRMRYQFQTDVAVAEDNTTMCAGIESQQWVSECYTRIGVKMRNMTLCESIESQTSKESCYKSVAAAG